MNFWDTVKGHELANTIIRYLPLIGRGKQYVKLVTINEFTETVEDELEKKRRYVGHCVNGPLVTIIFEE